MKCVHCNEELGNSDEYDLYKRHIYSCNSRVAKNFRNAKDSEERRMIQ